MSNNFFSPNQKISGGAAFFSFNSKDGCVYLKLLKQIANNANKLNNFDGKNPLNIKLSQDEAADIIRTIRTRGKSKFYHVFDNKKTSGSFNYYEIAPSKEGDEPKTGFGLTVKKISDENTLEIKVGFTPASAERLRLFLENALNHIFDQEHRDDIKRAEEFRANKSTKESPPQEAIESSADAEDQPGQDPEF